ncbi:MAG: hypothetical protein LQ352_001457 [Teloschistes flavicans]|nr:MAG: hypothetical protein LQ352_001457 [Teloschistes flavicans]
MNSLFNTALKQSSAVRRDLDAFAENAAASSPALQGQISASLTSLSRTIDDYTETAKKELIPAKQEKAYDRIKTFRSDLLDYRQSFERLKKDRQDVVVAPTIPPPLRTRTPILSPRPLLSSPRKIALQTNTNSNHNPFPSDPPHKTIPAKPTLSANKLLCPPQMPH